MRTLIVGANGQLGHTLYKKMGKAAVAKTQDDLDITDRAAVLLAFSESRPDVVINAAAYTNVDAAETNKEACYAVNVTGTKHLVEACDAMDATFVQISTDYVFDNNQNQSTPFTEIDAASPTGVYAQTKLESEDLALSLTKSFVVRTCGLYANDDGPTRVFKNFPSTILRLANSHPELRVVHDQICTPSYVPHVADAITALSLTKQYGRYHVTNQGATTWFDFATELLKLAGKENPVIPITTEQFGAVAPRPRYSLLSTEKYRALQLAELPSWQEGLRKFLENRVS